MFCRTCEEDKSDSDFYRLSNNAGYALDCRVCYNVKQRKRYHSNEKIRIKRIKNNVKNHQDKIRSHVDLVNSFKDRPCTDCKIKFKPWQMDLDHIRGEKIESVSNMVQQAFPLEILKAELIKCEVVCANCHRDRTHNRKFIK